MYVLQSLPEIARHGAGNLHRDVIQPSPHTRANRQLHTMSFKVFHILPSMGPTICTEMLYNQAFTTVQIDSLRGCLYDVTQKLLGMGPTICTEMLYNKNLTPMHIDAFVPCPLKSSRNYPAWGRQSAPRCYTTKPLHPCKLTASGNVFTTSLRNYPAWGRQFAPRCYTTKPSHPCKLTASGDVFMSSLRNYSAWGRQSAPRCYTTKTSHPCILTHSYHVLQSLPETARHGGSTICTGVLYKQALSTVCRLTALYNFLQRHLESPRHGCSTICTSLLNKQALTTVQIDGFTRCLTTSHRKHFVKVPGMAARQFASHYYTRKPSHHANRRLYTTSYNVTQKAPCMGSSICTSLLYKQALSTVQIDGSIRLLTTSPGMSPAWRLDNLDLNTIQTSPHHGAE
jgi:hypothetical protein